MLKINKSNWKWIVLFLVAFLTYLFLDIVDAAGGLRQWLICPFVILTDTLAWAFGIETLANSIDVDYPLTIGPLFRAFYFTIELGAIVAPIYLYRRSKKKTYLFLAGVVIGWLITSYWYWFFMLLSMTGMMD